MSAPIVITVPTKYIPINLAPVTIKQEPISLAGSDAEESASSMDEFLARGKKRRLDHLTWEEKLQRKKLKNRVAAQTSRDRKKAKMEDMEKTIEQQTDQINELQNKCDQLQLEKNAIYGKYLDLESRFEELQRRLDEQQQQQQAIPATVTIKSEPDVPSHSVGFASTLLGSAAGNLFDGSTDDTASGADLRRRKDSGALEDNCPLPALQDMLEELDVSNLEELAESLLADVTSELESTIRGSCPADAQDASPGFGVPGSMVGTPPEQLESSEETNQGSSLILTTHNYSKSPFHVEKPTVSLQQQSDSNHSQMVYGTYDDETNCITIVMNEDEQLEEQIIYEEESDEELLSDREQEQEFNIKLEPVQELLSPIPSICSNYSSPSEADEIKSLQEELERHVHETTSKCPLTPTSFDSDGGYESLGSPTGSSDFGMGNAFDEFWNLDLFPILN